MTDSEIGGKLNSTGRATSRPVDASCVQTGRDSAAGKDFNTDLGAGLDSLNTEYGHIGYRSLSIVNVSECEY